VTSDIYPLSLHDALPILLREAQAMARLSHPNVVVIHDVGTHEGHIFIVMEFIKGMSLRQWLMQPHSLDAILDAFMQAGHGLAARSEEHTSELQSRENLVC